MIDRILTALFQICVALTAALLVAIPLTRYATEQRGYHAYGGEWFLIIGTFLLVCWLFDRKNKNTERNEENDDEN